MSLEQSENLSSLKKISQSCFDGQPDYIRWLTVDADGGAWFSIHKPEIGESSFLSQGDDLFFLGDGFDPADWQNSATERISPSDTALLWTHDVDSGHVYTLEEAVGMYVYECEYNDEKPSEIITMHAFKHKDMGADWFADGALEDLIMRLDDEYGHPEDATEVTQKMKDAALVFVRAVTADYKVWQVEPIGSIQIKISDYRSAS